MKKGIIFDLDGTLWDASAEVAKSWSKTLFRLLGKKDLVTPEAMRSCMGLPMTGIADKLFPDFEKEKRYALLEQCSLEENEEILHHPGLLYEGVEETLTALKKEGYFLYVLSNCQKGYIEAFLGGTHLEDRFDGHICWGDNGLPKNQNIRLLIEENHLDRAIYVGDTDKDEAETRLAGIPFVHASYGFGKANNPDARLTRFSDLFAISKSIFA